MTLEHKQSKKSIKKHYFYQDTHANPKACTLTPLFSVGKLVVCVCSVTYKDINRKQQLHLVASQHIGFMSLVNSLDHPWENVGRSHSPKHTPKGSFLLIDAVPAFIHIPRRLILCILLTLAPSFSKIFLKQIQLEISRIKMYLYTNIYICIMLL